MPYDPRRASLRLIGQDGRRLRQVCTFRGPASEVKNVHWFIYKSQAIKTGHGTQETPMGRC